MSNGVDGLLPNGHEARFVALPGDPDNAVFGVEILQSCARKFACAEAARVKELQHCLVAETERLCGVRCGEEAFNVEFVERFRKKALDARKRQDFRGIVRNARAGREPAEEDL